MPTLRFTALLLSQLAVLPMLPGCSDASSKVFPGYAEAEYVRLASPIGGNLARVYLSKGDAAGLNLPAFVLEQESERAARIEAESQVGRAAALLANLQTGGRAQEVAAVRAQLAQAQAALQLSIADLQRQTQLAADNFVSAARADEARTAVARDRALVRELQARLQVVGLAARPAEIRAAEQALRAAQAQLSQAEWRLDQKTRLVPVAGKVVDVLYREGEFVPAGSPVMTLLPPQNIKARFFVPETALGSLRIGQPVSLRCDGCGAPVGAHISFIAAEAEYTSPLIYSRENRASLVFMIEARPAAADAVRLHPGQPLEIGLARKAPQ